MSLGLWKYDFPASRQLLLTQSNYHLNGVATKTNSYTLIPSPPCLMIFRTTPPLTRLSTSPSALFCAKKLSVSAILAARGCGGSPSGARGAKNGAARGRGAQARASPGRRHVVSGSRAGPGEGGSAAPPGSGEGEGRDGRTAAAAAGSSRRRSRRRSQPGCPAPSAALAACLAAPAGERERGARRLREPDGEDAPGTVGGPLAEDGCGEHGREQHRGTGRAWGGVLRGKLWGEDGTGTPGAAVAQGMDRVSPPRGGQRAGAGRQRPAGDAVSAGPWAPLPLRGTDSRPAPAGTPPPAPGSGRVSRDRAALGALPPLPPRPRQGVTCLRGCCRLGRFCSSAVSGYCRGEFPFPGRPRRRGSGWAGGPGLPSPCPVPSPCRRSPCGSPPGAAAPLSRQDGVAGSFASVWETAGTWRVVKHGWRFVLGGVAGNIPGVPLSVGFPSGSGECVLCLSLLGRTRVSFPWLA